MRQAIRRPHCLRRGRIRLALALVAAAIIVGAVIGLIRKQPAGETPERPAPPEVAQVLPPPPRSAKSVTICAAGDVMLDRSVWRMIKQHGVHHVMSEVRDTLRAADITFVNLECPLSTRQGHAQPGGSLQFCADPSTVQVLLDGGVDVVGVANNHGLDAGTGGCYDTLATLEEHNIAYAGARPKGVEPDDEPTYLTVDDTVVAFLAYDDLSFARTLCDVDQDMGNALTQIKEARNNADVTCVSYHWGNEYQKTPTRRQKQLAHASIDAGADIVLGHHAHVMNGVEAYGGGLILYSMGNFVFDQRDAPDGRMTSAIFSMDVTVGKGIDLTISPVRISPQMRAPRTPTQERGTAILRGLAKLSADLGVELTIEGQKARASFATETAIDTQDTTEIAAVAG